jgi:hypothetical protein
LQVAPVLVLLLIVDIAADLQVKLILFRAIAHTRTTNIFKGAKIVLSYLFSHSSGGKA